MTLSKTKLRQTIDTLASYDRPISVDDYINLHSILLHKEKENLPTLNYYSNPHAMYVELEQMHLNWIMLSDLDYRLKSYILLVRELSDEYRRDFFTLKFNNNIELMQTAMLKSNIADRLISSFHKFMCFDCDLCVSVNLFFNLHKKSYGFMLNSHGVNSEFKQGILASPNTSHGNITSNIIDALSYYNIKKYTLNNGEQQFTFAYNDYNCEWESYENGEQYV